jgi:predicted O-methyltransferase YrrM
VDLIYSAKNYIKYRLSAGTRHDVHSPFVYDLLNNVIRDKTPYYGFEVIESLRSKHQLDRKLISISDFGTGKNLRTERISDIVKNAVQPKKYSQLLFRLVNYFEPRYVLELGTSLGITTLYLSLPNKDIRIITLEGSSEISKIAKHNFNRLKRTNIEQITGEFNEVLPVALKKFPQVDIVYFDGNHRKEPTLNYFKACLPKANENSIFIFDDIHWDKDMNDAWEEIKADESVTLSIDLFKLGIVFFRKGIERQHFVLKF